MLAPIHPRCEPELPGCRFPPPAALRTLPPHTVYPVFLAYTCSMMRNAETATGHPP